MDTEPTSNDICTLEDPVALTRPLSVDVAQLETLHNQLCPRQMLGLRMGRLVADLFGFDLPQSGKRLLAIVETDGCFVDGITVTTGCTLGHRTLRLEDLGRVAATFVDTHTGAAFRISPQPGCRDRAANYAPAAITSWQAQLEAYQVMPDHELLRIEPVTLRDPLYRLAGHASVRAICAVCSEEILNQREESDGSRTICRACAGQGYYDTGPGLATPLIDEADDRPPRDTAERWAEGLVDIGKRIANMEDVDQTLGAIVGLAHRLLASDIAMFALWDSTGDHLEIKACSTERGMTSLSGRYIQSDEYIAALRAGQSLCLPQGAPRQPFLWHCPVLNLPIVGAVIAPLHVDGKSIGAILVARSRPQPYLPSDVAGLERLADQAIIALEHAAMAGELQSLAVIEERARIAREMHDSLAQILGYLSLQTQTLEVLVAQGQTERALEELRLARDCIKTAQADVRESILSLRTTLAGDIGLIAALDEYVEEFGTQAGIDACLRTSLTEQPPLSPLAETQLVRIVQEALTNVRKHAQAEQVDVLLHIQGSDLHVAVVDSGIGFDVASAKRSTYGLQTMRERVESIGGSVHITSVRDHGTRVELTVPLLHYGEVYTS